MSTEPKAKRRTVLALSVVALVLCLCLFQLGILNPWRIARRTQVLLHQRKEFEIDHVEHNLADISRISLSKTEQGSSTTFWSGEQTLTAGEIQRIKSILTHLRSFDDHDHFPTLGIELSIEFATAKFTYAFPGSPAMTIPFQSLPLNSFAKADREALEAILNERSLLKNFTKSLVPGKQ